MIRKVKAPGQFSKKEVEIMHREEKKQAKKGSKENTKAKVVSAEDTKKHTSKGTIEG